MKIKLIRNEGCHIWEKAEEVLKETLKDAGLSTKYNVVVVENNKDAEKFRFFGSPQITIDDKDIDPKAEKATQFQAEGCRIYVWNEKMYEYPPKELILQALSQN